MIPHLSDLIDFVRFLEELKTPKRHFEINCPLEVDSSKHFQFFLQQKQDTKFQAIKDRDGYPKPITNLKKWD